MYLFYNSILSFYNSKMEFTKKLGVSESFDPKSPLIEVNRAENSEVSFTIFPKKRFTHDKLTDTQ
jgi:hypothetical protein